MRLLHNLAVTHATFDDLHLASQAGLVPVMALAGRAGLGDLAGGYARIGRRDADPARSPAPRRADFSQVAVDATDLRGAELGLLIGQNSLRGAVVSTAQLVHAAR